MRKPIYLVLILLAILSIALEGCSRSSSRNVIPASEGGNGGGNSGGNNGGDPGDPPGDPPEDPVPPDIWIAADGVEITDPNSGNDGIAEPGEEVEFRITITNLGESDGMIDIVDLKIDPANGLSILTRRLDGIDVPDFNGILVPGEGAVVADGTALVDPSIEVPIEIILGPPELAASTPPTDPETVIDPEQILGTGSIQVTEEGGPPPPPPEEEILHVRKPGSVLIYPFYRVEESIPDKAVSKDTMITVTNVNPDMKLDQYGLPGGTIDVRFVFQDVHDNCLPFDCWKRLTPYDTFSVMLSDYIPFHGLSEGWFFLHAVDTETGESLDFDYLIGHAMYFDSEAMVYFSYNPLAYQGVPGHGLPTDLDLDGYSDLNGLEYQQVGDNQMYARFIGTYTNAVDAFKTDLLLVNLTGGIFFQSTLKFLIFNDNEQAWSAFYDFWCWEVVPLDAFGEVFTNEWLLNSNHDPDECLDLFGNPEMETGWFKMDGAFAWSPSKSVEDPAFVSLLLEWYNGRLLVTPPFDNGKQQDNATLWSVSVHGDNED
ncbi:MAG: hypothetical protein ACYTG7_24790 [Planctomycetota bacterium]|jgi:hypothetical protein